MPRIPVSADALLAADFARVNLVSRVTSGDFSYAAAGLTDAKLSTVGVWPKASMQNLVTDQPASDQEGPVQPEEEAFDQGLVFYLRDNQIGWCFPSIACTKHADMAACSGRRCVEHPGQG